MKIALYIEDGVEQIVLTPGSKSEQAICDRFHDEQWSLQIERGSFYGCRGGWMRHGSVHNLPTGRAPDDVSTILVLSRKS